MNETDKIYRDDDFIQLPTEVFFKIFTATGDLELVYLASMNLRYESIAKEVFQRRFEKKYFVIEGETERHRNEYSVQLAKFGDNVRGIEARYIRCIDENHWLAQLMCKFTPNLEKFCFHKCSFRKDTVGFLSRHLNLRHLTIRGGSAENVIHLPEYTHLKAIEISDFRDIDDESLLRTLQNNPQLESVIIRPSNPKYGFFTSAKDIVELVSSNLRCLKELNILGRYDYDDPEIAASSMDQFVRSLESLQSFGMSILRQSEVQLFSHLSAHCRLITSLEIKCFTSFRNMIQKICAFDRLETLSLSNVDNQQDIELIASKLLRLRFLTLSGLCNRTNDEILSIVRKCSLLEHLIIESKYYDLDTYPNDGDEKEQVFYYKLNVSFHKEFVRIIRNRSTKISFIQYGEVIGLVTKDEIVWRNKVLHWTGYSGDKSQLKMVNLLDFANVPRKYNANHEQLLHLIFDYLDLNCLYAFFRVNEECKQLVHNYINRCSERSSKQKLLITDEFGIYSDMLHTFGMKVINLELVFYMDCHLLRDDIEKYCKNLTTLSVRVYPFLYRAHFFTLPQVRRFVYNTIDDQPCHNCCVLDEVLRKCPDIEMLEFKAPIELCVHSEDKILFRNLKKIKFIPYGNRGCDVMALFEDTSTEIIIVDDEKCSISKSE